MSCAGISASDVQRANFHKKMKMMKLRYFCIFMYIWWLLKFLGVFFVCVINNKTHTILTKRPPVATTVPSGIIGALVYRVYLRIFDSGPSNPTTFLGLCSPGDYRQSIESSMGVPTFNSTEKSLAFTIYDCILIIRPKEVYYLTKVSPFDVELI